MKNKKLAVTMAEMMIVVVIVAIVAGVFLAMPKKNVSKMDRAKYYIAYDMLKKLQDEQMAKNGSVKIDKTNFGCAVNDWLNVVNLYNSTAAVTNPIANPSADCGTAVKATLTNGMVLIWDNNKKIHGDASLADSNYEARIFSDTTSNSDYLRVTVDLDGDFDRRDNPPKPIGLNTLNRDQYYFDLFGNGWVRPVMCYRKISTKPPKECLEADSVNIVIPFRVYGFDDNGNVINHLYNVDYNEAYNMYKCSIASQLKRPNPADNMCPNAMRDKCCVSEIGDCTNIKPCIMEAIPPLK